MALNGILTRWKFEYPEDAWEKFFIELQEYLRSKFEPVIMDDG